MKFNCSYKNVTFYTSGEHLAKNNEMISIEHWWYFDIKLKRRLHHIWRSIIKSPLQARKGKKSNKTSNVGTYANPNMRSTRRDTRPEIDPWQINCNIFDHAVQNFTRIWNLCKHVALVRVFIMFIVELNFEFDVFSSSSLKWMGILLHVISGQ